MIATGRFDFVLVGGGLANGLIALALRRNQPQFRVALVEKEEALGGNHSWSFHETDVPPNAAPLLEPLVQWRWPAYDVVFPDHQRTVALGYATFMSGSLRQALHAAAADSDGRLLILERSPVRNVSPHRVDLVDGRTLDAHVVVDARGPRSTSTGAGYQKFVGLDIEVETPHGIERPLVMDARVAQHDGFRFLYVLPLSPQRLLIEDTYFSSTPDLDSDRLRGRVTDEVQRRGWTVARVLREETGVLPMPWRGHTTQDAGVVKAGYAAGLFHPTTGYSLPTALKLAVMISTQDDLEQISAQLMPRFVESHRKRTRVLRILNWMMFNAVAPEARWRLLSRFYRLPVETIARFFAAELTRIDHVRLFSGPIPRGLSPASIIKAWEAQA